MSIRDGKAKADQVLGRVEEILGQSYADPAAEIHGEAMRLRGEAEEDADAEQPLEQTQNRTAERVPRAVSERSALHLRVPGGREDADLRAEVLQALLLAPAVPASVDARVGTGLVTLTGTADYRYQRDAAEEAARGVAGVVDVANEVALTDTTHVPAGVQNEIRTAFVRKAKLDADGLTVLASEGTVTLIGRVSSQEEHDVAVAAACAAPGVHAIDDRLTIAGRSEERP
jgi:osmotically-inducible protein OsmY